MWGNTLGWSISLIWVGMVCVAVAYIDRAGRVVSARTPFSADSLNAAAIELPEPPLTVLPQMTSKADAGPIYRRAIAQYHKDPSTYGRFSRSGRQRDIEDLPAVQTLLEATECASAEILAANPSEIVTYDNDKPALEALRTLGECATHKALLIQANDPQAAMALYEAVFSLGAKLYQERLSYAELDAGLTLMAEGATMIEKMSKESGDTARYQAARRFNDARAQYVKQRIRPAIRVIGSADQETLENYAGDVFYFARHAGDRMWRVEAILKLGRYRFNAGRIGDQRAASKVIEELIHDPDPVIKLAATAARDLSLERYRMLR